MDETGRAVTLAPGVVRVLAPNPSPMTFRGTNSYLVGEEELTLIDPGPDLPAHREALLAALAGRRLARIVVTHSHVDHSPLARPLGAELGVPVLAFGDSGAGRSAAMARLAAAAPLEGGEGVDAGFAPDRRLTDGEVLGQGADALTVLHTPGHMGNHVALLRGDTAFCGDLVMGWASSLVSPPDGDLGDFLASCRRLRALGLARLYPGHGDPVEDPAGRIDWLIAHREERSAQILAALAEGPRDIPALVARLYADVPVQMHPAAARNVLAHLIHLEGQGAVACDGPPGPGTIYRRT